MIKIIKSNNRCGAFYCKIKTKAKSYKKQEQREKGAEFAAKGKACDDDTHFEELTSMRGEGGSVGYDHQSSDQCHKLVFYNTFISVCLFVIVWARLQNGKQEKKKQLQQQ